MCEQWRDGTQLSLLMLLLHLGKLRTFCQCSRCDRGHVKDQKLPLLPLYTWSLIQNAHLVLRHGKDKKTTAKTHTLMQIVFLLLLCLGSVDIFVLV